MHNTGFNVSVAVTEVDKSLLNQADAKFRERGQQLKGAGKGGLESRQRFWQVVWVKQAPG